VKPHAPGTNRADLMFRAFSDRTRLRILCVLLKATELCVADLGAALRLPQPRTSRHLAYLRKCGLVAVRKAGPWSYYSLAPAEAGFHKKLIECLGSFLDVREIQADVGRGLKLKQASGCCPNA
jgi:ArsR family transcriptional regulator, arsenate/arsenite/antimonite-responsive transcriptional repressor